MPTLADWNVRILAEFRENAGYVAWSSPEEAAAGRPIPPRMPGFPDKGMPLILVHHVGAKTGKARISPLFYQPVGENWAVFGTHGGSPRDPAWYRNLMANPRTVVETGAGEIPVEARLAAGEERARIWADQIAQVPAFAEFEAASGRQVPVVLLERR
ncbi:nitroreductase/quinone reductase family protein [Amycolatopsis dendrobii]|uniref:Nitroreductase family deazaflavin-dependent oxidoreductase n=1 Tax=Amycolatopsis dendrobii TaxID=2760662 RepID=A0A7W3W717_9PSEU|nr:nitroreductase/quinone reductase family protein [Amycolatopsis dendrobii]MBB1159980.1 nitroreductase family deazaflavin-dependent oxidoreductase [Amycolatopsis dendrobii]